MRHLIAFLVLSVVKIISMIFYRSKVKWLNGRPTDPWKDLRLIVFLNHTSLYEPLFIQLLPFSFIWRLTPRLSAPAADITLKRPIVGTLWKLMFPNVSPVTRKKDSSWETFLGGIRPDSIIIITPEGRMKRPTGLDKFGKPMTVRGGVADIIEALDSGRMLIALSGGLHHVQAPGQFFPRLFKTIKMNYVNVDIGEYKKQFPASSRERKLAIVQDLQRRLEQDCPK